jgi:hypothetical protein
MINAVSTLPSSSSKLPLPTVAPAGGFPPPTVPSTPVAAVPPAASPIAATPAVPAAASTPAPQTTSTPASLPKTAPLASVPPLPVAAPQPTTSAPAGGAPPLSPGSPRFAPFTPPAQNIQETHSISSSGSIQQAESSVTTAAPTGFLSGLMGKFKGGASSGTPGPADVVPGGTGTPNPNNHVKVSLPLAIGMVVMVLLIIGGGIAYYESQQNQEIRQQAASTCTGNSVSQATCSAFFHSTCTQNSSGCWVSNPQGCTGNSASEGACSSFYHTACTQNSSGCWVSSPSIPPQSSTPPGGGGGGGGASTPPSSTAPTGGGGGSTTTTTTTTTNACGADVPVNTQFRPSGNGAWVSGAAMTTAKYTAGQSIDVNCFAKNGTALLTGGTITLTLPDNTTSQVSSGPQLRNYIIPTAGKFTFTCKSTTLVGCSDPDSFTALAGAATPTPSPSPSPSASATATPTPTPTPLTCNGSCTSDAECQAVNSLYVCYSATCRLATNPSDATCTVTTSTTTSTTTTTETETETRSTVPDSGPAPVSGQTENTILIIVAGLFFTIGGTLVWYKRNDL